MAYNSLIETREPMSRTQAAPMSRALATIADIPRNMFGLDYRSLALMRIGLGLCLFWNAYIHACEMRAFYTDEGVLPRAVLFNDPPDFLGFSLHFAGGGITYIAILFALQMILALMMTVGYRTRLATIGSYVLLLSMQNRQPVLLFGADIALRVGLFWTIFLPLAKRFSIDNLLQPNSPPAKRSYLGIAGIAFIVQVCMIYTGGALLKTGRTWQVDHTAVAYALALDIYSRPLGQWLGQFAGLCKVLTIFTFYLELYGPILFILPVLSAWGRSLGFLLFAGLQIGFGLCMTMGIFGPVMISLTLAFLPASFWDRFAQPWGRKLAGEFDGISDWLGRIAERNRSRATWLQTRMARILGIVFEILRDCALVLLMVVMILWNIDQVPGQPRRLSWRFTKLAYTIGIDQTWDMFAPDPQNYDGWFVIAGHLRNGQTVDLMTGASPASFDKPTWVAGSYHNQIWMSYLICLWDEGCDLPSLSKYLKTVWNEHHSGDEQLQSIEINAMEQTVWPDLSKSKPRRNLIWTQWF